jgi:protein SCO1/2
MYFCNNWLKSRLFLQLNKKGKNVMTRKQVFYILFFGGLIVVFYLALVKFIPGFSEAKSPPLSVVKPFSFTNQDGRQVTEKDVAGKVYMANFFFTTCKGICPRMNTNVREVYDHFKNEKNFLILSHTCDPGTDSAARLKRYADSMQVSTDHWIFLTGRKDSLYRQARLSYAVDDPKNIVKDINDDFLHTQLLALVNKSGEVVKVYDGLKKNEVNDLISDAEKLLKE